MLADILIYVDILMQLCVQMQIVPLGGERGRKREKEKGKVEGEQ